MICYAIGYLAESPGDTFLSCKQHTPCNTLYTAPALPRRGPCSNRDRYWVHCHLEPCKLHFKASNPQLEYTEKIILENSGPGTACCRTPICLQWGLFWCFSPYKSIFKSILFELETYKNKLVSYGQNIFWRCCEGSCRHKRCPFWPTSKWQTAGLFMTMQAPRINTRKQFSHLVYF